MMDDTESPTRLVGYHLPAGVGGWSPDVLGTLLGEYHDGWYIVSQHVSSNGQYSKADMQYHANKFDGVPYEWLGELTQSEAFTRFPPPPNSTQETGE